MGIRILSEEELENMSPGVRAQLKAALAEGPTMAPRPGRPEEAVGRRLVTWVDTLELEHPTLGPIRVGDYFYHVPNGGARTAAEGGVFKALGVRKGWPDYGLDLPLGPFHGFRLEIKAEHGAKPDAEQLEVLARLERAGYCVSVAWGYDDAKRSIERYLDLAR